jgi:hypothetical protein
MLIAAVGPRWCRHREEMIYTCTYSEMRILQLIISGTLANAGRQERVINNKQNKYGKLQQCNKRVNSKECRTIVALLRCCRCIVWANHQFSGAASNVFNFFYAICCKLLLCSVLCQLYTSCFLITLYTSLSSRNAFDLGLLTLEM